MNNQRTVLEQSSITEIPAANELAQKFSYCQNTAPASFEELAKIHKNLRFGVDFTDHMVSIQWDIENGWHDYQVLPYGPLSLDPACSVLHYGQEVFEGIKAYRHEDGSVWTFRPGFNAARLANSARRIALPELPQLDFIASLAALIQVDERWVPSIPGASLYFRPFIYASESFLGVRAAQKAHYLLIACPVSPYFKGGLSPVSIWVSKEYHRACPGGTGEAKTGGNYASSLLPQIKAAEKGYDQVCYLDQDYHYLEELGGMNVFIVYRDGSVTTPALTGTILEGGTRSAIITLLQDNGYRVAEKRIAIDELADSIHSGEVVEMFACGTAAVVTPIGRLASDDFTATIPGGAVTSWVYETLTGIQYGVIEDKYGWMYRLA